MYPESSTPAAKRRRVDAANVTLRKPFHSPVIKRPDDNDAGLGSRAPEQTAAAATTDEAYSASSPPSVPAIRLARSSLGALRQKTTMSPMQRGGVKPKGRSADTAAAAAVVVVVKHDDDGDHHHPGDALLALVEAHRHTAQDAVLRDLERRLETVRQAQGIQAASSESFERTRPGRAVDQGLKGLVCKWKGASRMAAEEVFEIVKERVANSGGPKAWKEMRRRQMEFYQGWDQEEASKKTSDEDEDEDEGKKELQEEYEGDDDGTAEEEALQAKRQVDLDEEEEDESEFNMAQMLQSLNIDLALLGYDEVEEKWID